MLLPVRWAGWSGSGPLVQLEWLNKNMNSYFNFIKTFKIKSCIKFNQCETTISIWLRYRKKSVLTLGCVRNESCFLREKKLAFCQIWILQNYSFSMLNKILAWRIGQWCQTHLRPSAADNGCGLTFGLLQRTMVADLPSACRSGQWWRTYLQPSLLDNGGELTFSLQQWTMVADLLCGLPQWTMVAELLYGWNINFVCEQR